MFGLNTNILAASGDTIESMMMLGGVIVVVSLAMISVRRRASHRAPSPSDTAREYARRIRDDQQVKGDMEALLVEIQEMARQISAQFDTKFAKLEVLLHDADDRIARLERLTAAAGRPSVDVTVDDNGTRGQASAGDTAEPAPNDEHRQIYSLADAGRSPLQIAQETGHNTGEIELILALRKDTPH